MQQIFQGRPRQAKDLKARALTKGFAGPSPLKAETAILTGFPRFVKAYSCLFTFLNSKFVFSHKDLNAFCATRR